MHSIVLAPAGFAAPGALPIAAAVPVVAVEGKNTETPPPVLLKSPQLSLQINDMTADNLLSATEAGQANVTVSGVVGGDVQNGDVVNLVVNATSYSATVLNGAWSVAVSSTDLLADADKTLDASITISRAGGTVTALDTHNYSLAPLQITVTLDANITANDVIDSTEAAGPVAISGTISGADAKVGQTVVLTVAGNDYSATVIDVAGTLRFTANVPGAALTLDPDLTVQARVTATAPSFTPVTALDSEGYSLGGSGAFFPTVSAQLNPSSDTGVVGDNITSDKTPTISGQSQAGNHIVVTIPGLAGLLTTTAAADGSWSVTPGTNLADGPVTVNVVATNPSNQSATTQVNILIDSAIPLTAQLDPLSDSNIVGDNITNDTTPTIRGTATAGDTITVTIPGLAGSLTTTAAADGSWSVTPPVLANNTYTATVVATDVAGNSNTQTVNFTVDTAIPLTAQLNPLSDSNIVGDNITNDTTPTLIGMATAGDTITVTIPGLTGTLTTTAAADGSWSMTPGSSLADNTYTATVVATDIAGNSNTRTVAFTVDTTILLTAQLDPLSDSNINTDGITNDNTPTIRGTATAGETVTVTIPGLATPLTTIAAADGSWSVTPTTLADNSYIATVLTSDVAGNGAITTVNFTVDTAISLTAMLDPTSDSGVQGDSITNDSTPTISGFANAGDTVTVTLPFTNETLTTIVPANGTFTLTPINALPDGLISANVTAIDLAGNSTSTTVNFTVDTAIPLTAQLDPLSDSGVVGDNITNDTTPTLKGTATAGDSITVTIPGVAGTLTTIAAANGSWSVTPSSLADNTYTATVVATDVAGNTNTQTVNFTTPASRSQPSWTP